MINIRKSWVIPREARRITYSTEIRNLKKRFSFSNIQKEVLIGSILGDGHLENNWSKTNYRLMLGQSVKQKDYLFWKYAMFKDIVLSKPRFNEITKSVSFATISHPEISELARLFYRGKIKVIPDNISEFVGNPIVMAVWFMDDGNVITRNGKTYGYHLNTQSYTEDENKKISCVLRNTYGIESLLEINHDKYRLRIMQKPSRDNFRKLIEDHVIDSMKYKLG